MEELCYLLWSPWWSDTTALAGYTTDDDDEPVLHFFNATMSVSICLSVTEVNWRIIGNLGFKFWSKFTAHCRRGEGSPQQ